MSNKHCPSCKRQLHPAYRGVYCSKRCERSAILYEQEMQLIQYAEREVAPAKQEPPAYNIDLAEDDLPF